ncbi:hypothetical protein B0H16DRAFT_1585408 [Mycena metata]|uniref:Uncharacterized protein n=1 Tax=Mycena metata TaxID=1033252 RepID=A0AAD7HY64_9AGAR|nr:hypothetical protein B0H16DRAFT_1585408 [Mycena metata]
MSPPLAQTWSPNPQIFSQVILGLVIPGVILTAVLLILYGYAAWNPVSRRYLDRVSFRLLVYALGAHLVFGIVMAVSTLKASGGWSCGLLAFITDLSLMFSTGIFFCMAFNLPLVLAYDVNGQKMLKWYLLGTAVVSLICNVTPYASGKLGRAVNDTCWYRGTDPADSLRWLIGTQTVWILLTSWGEVSAFLLILTYLVIYELDTRRNRRDKQLSGTYTTEASRRTGSSILRFRNIIVRIGMYPLVSCLLNIGGAVLDLYEIRHAELTKLNWRLSLADLAIYAGRPLIYGLLAATDPSFIRALRVLWHHESASELEANRDFSGAQWAAPSGCLSTVIIEMPLEETRCEPNGVQKERGGANTQTNEMSFITHAGAEDKGGEQITNWQIGIRTNAASNSRGLGIDVVCHI